MSAIVFDLGGTFLRCAVAEESGGLQSIQKHRIDRGSLSPGFVWKEIVSLIQAYQADVRSRVSHDAIIVISFPGPVVSPSKVLNAPTVGGSEEPIPDLQSELARVTGRNVYIINDISAAAWHFSQSIGVNRFMILTVSSGIGSKIFDKRHLFGVFDDLPYAGEIGHMRVDFSPFEVTCDCGGRDHLGAIASGRGIERIARLIANQNVEFFSASKCRKHFGATPDTITNEDHIVPAALAGDRWALEVVRRCTRPLAKAIMCLSLGVGLERVIIIGGFALALGKTYLEILQTCLIENCDYEIFKKDLCELLVLGDMKEEACLQGAARYAKDMMACRR